MSNQLSKDDLLNIKKDIEETKDIIKDKQASLKFLKQQLKNDWDCNSVNEAKKILKNIETEITDFEETIATKIQEISEEYNIE